MKKLFLIVVLALASLTGAFAQFDPYEAIPDDPEVRKGVLENGMTYYIRHNAKPENQADFYIFHNVGGIQEEDSQQGLAHFTEHMAFNGTKNLPGKQLLDWAESVGIKYGANLNAGTSQEYTYYMMENVPLTRGSIVDSALLVLHDWSHFIAMEPDEIDKERAVIVEELRNRQDANWRVMEKRLKYLFGNTKYAERNLIGYEESLRTFPHQDLTEFYHRWYRPDLQAIVVVGDFDVDAMETKIKALMADIPAVENPEEKAVVSIPANEEPMVGVITDPELTNSAVDLYIRRDAVDKELNNIMLVRLFGVLDDLAISITRERLSDMAQKPGAPFTSASIFSSNLVEKHDVIGANAQAREGETLQAFEALYTEIERAARYGFTESELERAKANYLRSAQQTYDRRDDRRNSEFALAYIDNYKYNTPIPTAEKAWEIDQMLIDLIELPILNQFAQTERFLPNNQVVIVTAPEKEGSNIPTTAEVEAVIAKVRAAEIEAPVDNTVKEPLIPEGTKFKGSKVKKTSTDKFGATVWTLKNGIRVAVKPTDFKTDEILVGMEAMGGLSRLPVDMLSSAAVYDTYVSMAGLGKFPANELRKQLTGKAVSLGPWLDPYSNGYTGSASPKDLETLMQLIYLNFTAPRYSESDYGVMMDRLNAQYLNMSSNPAMIFNDSLTNTLYDRNPRRRMFTYDRVNEVNFDHMKVIHSLLFSNAADFVFTFVGNIDIAEFKPMVEKYLGSLPTSGKGPGWIDDGTYFAKGVVENRFTAAMQMPKTTVVYAHVGEMPYTLKNVLVLESLSQILDIRYNLSIREEKGGTYGVTMMNQADFTPKEDYLLLATFDTDPVMADELIEIITLEIQKIADEGIIANDLAKVKEYLAKEYPDDIRQNSYWRSVIRGYHATGYDLHTGYMEEVYSISGEDIQAFARKIIEDNNIVKVIMDPAE